MRSPSEQKYRDNSRLYDWIGVSRPCDLPTCHVWWDYKCFYVNILDKIVRHQDLRRKVEALSDDRSIWYLIGQKHDKHEALRIITAKIDGYIDEMTEVVNSIKK